MCRNNQILVQAYFPPINQSEGVPLKIWDIKGKEWTFQFRFWPNNNNCMYVLEGVNPCIQNMQLEAGDTDPKDKLVIGCRKATVLADAPASSYMYRQWKLTDKYDTRRHQ
ncbi:putative DNA-binding pseudobarrel domain superfamily [Helianthus annuus]|nr:putative DNA-binding pseudobarrel domain superfamily [Helianthus annuus]